MKTPHTQSPVRHADSTPGFICRGCQFILLESIHDLDMRPCLRRGECIAFECMMEGGYMVRGSMTVQYYLVYYGLDISIRGKSH
jgi:hypothetical protein